MKNLMKRQFCYGTAVSMLCLFQVSHIGIARAECANVADGCLKVNSESLQIMFQQIEIVPQGQSVQLVPDGTPLGTLPPPPVNTQISRTINDLWQLEVPDGSQNNLTVDYHYGNLNHSSQGNSVIQLQSIDSIPPTVLGPSSINPGKVVVQGGATFHFNVSNLKASGSYSGNLQITVTGF